jgi:hypothetical protein
MAQGTRQARTEGSSGPTSFMILYVPEGMIPAIERLEPTTLQGTIVEMSCFRKMGGGSAASPEQVACAKAAMKAGGVIGILSDGDGVFKLVGNLTANKYAKLVPFLGRRIEMPGVEVILSNNFDYRAYEGFSIIPAKQ